MKNKKTFKEAFGKNPWDPWSAKANLSEDGLLDKYLLSRGLNPETISKDRKIAHSKSNQFKQWAMNQKEEVEIDDNLIEAVGGQLHRYLLSRGLDPGNVSKDTKIAHAKSNQFKQWAMNQKEEVELEEGSVQDKFHARHQELRKKSGLPHPNYYKELGKSYDIEDDKERLAKQSEVKKKYNVESILYDDPKGTLTRVAERKKELSRSARIIKALYKRKGVKEDTYDWEKDDKSTASYGKQPKMVKSDDKTSKVKKESDAAAVLSGGTTLTKQKRDIVELDPKMKVRSNKDAQDANDNNTKQ